MMEFWSMWRNFTPTLRGGSTGQGERTTGFTRG
jgi:hypothetical protein